SRGVVVRAGTRMIEMATEDDLLIAQIASRNRGGGDVVRARLVSRADKSVHADRFAGGEALLQRACGPERDHECERPLIVGREGLQMAPADERVVLAVPRRALVLRVTDDSRGAETPHGQRRNT